MLPTSEASLSQNLRGLTQAEVVARRAAGQSNGVPLKSSRSIRQILQENLFTFINAVFFVISLVMAGLGRWGDAILVVIVIFGSVVVNIYQEIWAKQTLDRIALLYRPKITAVRDFQEQIIDPAEIVQGDLLVARSGDQIMVDGYLVAGNLEIDESLLTGESDLVPKATGESVYSGSVCVSGSGYYEAQQVGKTTFAYKLVSGARAYRRVLTPLQKEINLVIRVFMLIACFLWILVGISFFSRDHSLNDLAQRAAVVAGLVPAGLLLAITLAYGLGAVRMVGQHILIQQANAVESLSNVNVLCLDKTGTLTTNQIELQAIKPIESADRAIEPLQNLLGAYAASTPSGTRTEAAMLAVCPGQVHPIAAAVPFSSARKWSAIQFMPDPQVSWLNAGTYVLGAPEILEAVAPLSAEVQQQIHQAATAGLRVVLFTHSPSTVMVDAADRPQLPTPLTPLALLLFSDQIRPEAPEILESFTHAGIAIKIISGDHPETVAALAQRVGVIAEEPVSGQDLMQMDRAQFQQTVMSSTIFGRITPDQKAAIVQALRRQGQYVAMTGDGVNDVLALKQADLAIAMESGSKATRGAADIVLLKDDFGALPQAFLEGQRIRNGIQDVLKLFLVRTFCITLLIFATAIVTDSFPLANKQSAVVGLIGVGFPTMFLPIWAKPGVIPRRSLVRSILHFVVPATLTLTLVSLIVYLFYLVVAILNLPPGLNLSQVNYSVPRSALVTILVMGELLLIPFLKPPSTAWAGGEPLSGDWRYSIVALVLLGVYILVLIFPPLRHFFELYPLGVVNHCFIGFVAIEWALILRATWRSRLLDRILGVDLS